MAATASPPPSAGPRLQNGAGCCGSHLPNAKTELGGGNSKPAPVCGPRTSKWSRLSRKSSPEHQNGTRRRPQQARHRSCAPSKKMGSGPASGHSKPVPVGGPRTSKWTRLLRKPPLERQNRTRWKPQQARPSDCVGSKKTGFGSDSGHSKPALAGGPRPYKWGRLLQKSAPGRQHGTRWRLQRARPRSRAATKIRRSELDSGHARSLRRDPEFQMEPANRSRASERNSAGTGYRERI